MRQTNVFTDEPQRLCWLHRQGFQQLNNFWCRREIDCAEGKLYTRIEEVHLCRVSIYPLVTALQKIQPRVYIFHDGAAGHPRFARTKALPPTLQGLGIIIQGVYAERNQLHQWWLTGPMPQQLLCRGKQGALYRACCSATYKHELHRGDSPGQQFTQSGLSAIMEEQPDRRRRLRGAYQPSRVMGPGRKTEACTGHDAQCAEGFKRETAGWHVQALIVD